MQPSQVRLKIPTVAAQNPAQPNYLVPKQPPHIPDLKMMHAKPPEMARKPAPPPPTPAPPAAAMQQTPIASFIELEIEARKCTSIDALKFAMVNSTRKVSEYDQAFLVECGDNQKWKITLASSVSKIDSHAHMIQKLDAWLQHPDHDLQSKINSPRLTNLGKECADWKIIDADMIFPHALWLPIKGREGRAIAGFLALRKDEWRPQHSALLMPLGDVYGHAWQALMPNNGVPIRQIRRHLFSLRYGAALLLLAAAFIPLDLTVLAPTEIVAANPIVVSAPMDGTIEELPIAPGQVVKKGDVVIKLNTVRLSNDVEAATRRLALADAKYINILQTVLANQEQSEMLNTSFAELNISKAELAYAQVQLDRASIRATQDGLLIYASKSDLIGKPVGLGQRLMEIGDPNNTVARIDMPVSDAIALAVGNPVSLFLDGDPTSAIPAKIASVSYRPILNAEQRMVFRVHAKFDDDSKNRIGLHGVSRIGGEEVSLWYYLFRRPISAVRQYLGQ